MPPLTLDQKAAYLAAFIDGEGWVTFRQSKRRATQFERQIGFTNTDKQLFDLVVGYARDLGLTFSSRYQERKNVKHSSRWNAELLGGAKQYRHFAQIVPLGCVRKIENLKGILGSYKYNPDGSLARGMAAADPLLKAAVLAEARRVYATMKAEP